MKKDKIRDSVMAAIESSSEPLTQILRQNLMADGWDRDAVSSVAVSSSKTDLTISSPSKSAADLEYGTESTPPNAGVRRFANRTDVIEKTILDQAEQSLRGVL